MRLTCVIACVLLHAGCIPVPLFHAPVEGRVVTRELGDADSRRPLRVARSSRADVERRLGPPWRADTHWTYYYWRTADVLWLYPLWFWAQTDQSYHTVELRFDASGTLRSYRVLDGGAETPPLPPHFQHAPRLHAVDPAATLPTP